jgi:transcriptional regulator with XRE-family HTH domain
LLTFGQRVEMARVNRNMTKQRLEQEAGLARGYVSRITSGEQGGTRPGAGTVGSLARVLVVDESWLLTGVGRGPGDRGSEPLHAVSHRPNLEQAANILRRDGAVSVEVVAHVRETTERLGELDIGTWIQILADIQRRR